MTLQEFYDALEDHDWYYEQSDDHGVWLKGTAARNKLSAEAQTDPAKMALFRDYQSFMFSGELWGRDQAPKPARPD